MVEVITSISHPEMVNVLGTEIVGFSLSLIKMVLLVVIIKVHPLASVIKTGYVPGPKFSKKPSSCKVAPLSIE